MAGAANFLLWCVAIWLLWLAGTPFVFVESIPLLPYPDESLLAEGRGWNPLLAAAAAAGGFSEVPYWLGTLGVAVLLTIGVRWRSAFDNPWVLAVGIVGLAAVPHRSPIGDLLCVLLVASLWQRGERIRSEAALVFVASLFLSLEFGLIAVLLLLDVVGPQIARARVSHATGKAWGTAVGWILLIGLPGLFFAGYYAALLRLFSWAWLDAPATLLPTMVPLWESEALHWSHALMAVPILERLRQAALGRLPLLDCVAIGFLTWLAIGCTHYFWLASAALLLVTGRATAAAPVENVSVPDQRYARCGWILLGVALLSVVVQFTRNGATLLASDNIQRVIDPDQWDARGRVMLSNLEESSAWQHLERRRQYQLILTDRWDIHHGDYVRYRATFEDWSNWRREAYLRDNGRWGGYGAVFSEWDPELVVVDGDELAALHRVSIDSKWKVIGVDHEKVVFASSDEPRNRDAIQRGAKTLATLELPRPGAAVDFGRVVAIGSGDDSVEVSAILTALRLPYAGLRVLPRHGPAFTSTAAATASRFAWCELAHRSHRYSGQHSLLDCCRGLSPAELGGGDSLVAATKRYREALTAAVRRDGSQSFPGDLPSAASEVERTVRQHLKLGEAEQAIQHAAGLTDEGVREFYAAIAESAWRSPAEMIERFQSLSGRLSGERRAECLFYLGCLAIESDDFLRAREAFREVSESSPPSPFKSLAEFYVSQL